MSAGILGFLVQCGVCPQQAVLATQPSKGGWVCPRCAEVVDADDDEYPIAKVRI